MIVFALNIAIHFQILTVPEGEPQDPPPSMAEDMEMYVRQHLRGKKNLKLAELPPPGRGRDCGN